VGEAARVLRQGGALVASALRRHRHEAVAAAFDHRQPGFEPARFAELFRRAGCEVSFCELTSRERRPPHFEIITLYATRRPGGSA
jgi:ArsR family transcriptional regulator